MRKKRIIRFSLSLCALFFLPFASATEKQLPYLGPGSDKLSPEEYRRTYSKYIRESILMGYPPVKCTENACEQSLQHLFRVSGLFDYPVPAGANIVAWRNKNRTLECYQTGGVIAQVRREGKALESVLIINTSSPKVVKKLVRICKKRKLKLVRDKKTALERIEGVPVGYPHPLLCASSQGVFVRELRYNKQRTACSPMEYLDNSWVGGFVLDKDRCVATQQNLNRVWRREIPPSRFASMEKDRQMKRAVRFARSQGASNEEALKQVQKHFSGAFSNDVTFVGIAMRNLEKCNLLGLGDSKPRDGSKTGSDQKTSGSKKAR